MSTIIMPGAPFCPLCGKRMREIYTSVGLVYACLDELCNISINAKDPCVNKWGRVGKQEKPPVCPRCGTTLVHFFRSDRFVKSQCPKCRKEGRLVQVMKGKVEHMGDKWFAEGEEV